MIRVRHLVHPVEHLTLAGVGVLADAVQSQRLWRAAPALIQVRDESGAGPESFGLIHVHTFGSSCFSSSFGESVAAIRSLSMASHRKCSLCVEGHRT